MSQKSAVANNFENVFLFWFSCATGTPNPTLAPQPSVPLLAMQPQSAASNFALTDESLQDNTVRGVVW